MHLLFLVLLILISVFSACRPIAQYYNGLSQQSDASLQLTLNIGIMNDSRYPQWNRKMGVSLFAQTALDIPDFSIEYIIDQPQNLVYIFEETYMEKEAQLKYQSLLENLGDRGVGDSLEIWKIFLMQQVRYDIILSNVYVNKSNPSLLLVSVPGRQSLEGFGIFIAAQPPSTTTTDTMQLSRVVQEMIQQLVFLSAHAHFEQKIITRDFLKYMLQVRNQWLFRSKLRRADCQKMHNLFISLQRNTFTQSIAQWRSKILAQVTKNCADTF